MFWDAFNLTSWLILTLPLALVALAQQYNLISGLFDISIGSVMSLTVVLLSFTLPDLSPGAIVKSAAVLVVAVVAVGAFNAPLIEALKVTPIVATVASLGVVQGVAIWLRPEYGGIIAGDLYPFFAKSVGFVPISFIVVVVLAIALELWLYRALVVSRCERPDSGRIRPASRMAGPSDPNRCAVHLHARRCRGRCRPGEPGGRGCEQHRQLLRAACLCCRLPRR